MDKFTRNTLITILALTAVGGFFASEALTSTNPPQDPSPINQPSSASKPGTLTIKLNKVERPADDIFAYATVTLTNQTDKPIFYNGYSLHAFVYEPGTKNQIDSAAAIELRAMQPSDVKVILPSESQELTAHSWMIPQDLKTADVVVRLDTWMKIDTRIISRELKQKYPDAVLLSEPAVTSPAPLPEVTK